jgi:hypothetical protein
MYEIRRYDFDPKTSSEEISEYTQNVMIQLYSNFSRPDKLFNSHQIPKRTEFDFEYDELGTLKLVLTTNNAQWKESRIELVKISRFSNHILVETYQSVSLEVSPEIKAMTNPKKYNFSIIN